jgi:hypothetical protein
MPPRGPLVEASGKADLSYLGIIVDETHGHIVFKIASLLQLVNASANNKRKADRHEESCIRVPLPVMGTSCSFDRYRAVALEFSDSLQPAYFGHVHVRANQVNGFAAWQIDLGKIDLSVIFEKLDIKIGEVDQSGAADTTDNFPLFDRAAGIDAAGDPGKVYGFAGEWPVVSQQDTISRMRGSSFVQHSPFADGRRSSPVSHLPT